MTIVLYGDPHGEFRFLLDACARHRPEAVVLLGDMMLRASLRETLAPLFDSGIAVHYVAGNWDFHGEEWFDRLFASHPTGDLHGACRTIGGLEVGGISGVFLKDVWLPRSGGEEPRFRSQEEMLRAVPPREQWRVAAAGPAPSDRAGGRGDAGPAPARRPVLPRDADHPAVRLRRHR